MIYVIQKIHHFTLISRGCAWLSMKRGGCKFGGSKTGAVLCPKRGAVVSQLVFKLKESVPPPPSPGGPRPKPLNHPDNGSAPDREIMCDVLYSFQDYNNSKETISILL